jgi:hypothetical protein
MLGTGLLPYVRNTYSSINVPKHSFQEFVCQNAGCVGKAEQAVVGENCADAKEMCVQDTLMPEGR